MRFYQLRINEGFEVFRDKVDIIEKLLEPPASIPFIESNYHENGLGKKAAREIVNTTTSTLLLVILLSLATFVVIHFPSTNTFIQFFEKIIFLLPIFCYFLWLLFHKRILYSFRPRNFGESEVAQLYTNFLTKEIIEGGAKRRFILPENDYEARDFFNLTDFDKYQKIRRLRAIQICVHKKSQWRQWWVNSVILNIPFSIRNIWLWTFAIAVFTLFFNKDYHKLIENGDVGMFQEFLADFFRALLIGVVAYIATNVISELLQLREQYVDGKKQMDNLKKTIEKANKTMDNTVANVENIYSISGISLKLQELRESLSIANPLTTVFKDFTKTVSNQLDIFRTKVSSDEIIDTWLFSAVNQYFIQTSEEFNLKTSLITKFEFFGKILHKTIDSILSNTEFLKLFKEQYEIYTVLVLPPKRFLNYDKDEKGEVKRNPNWDLFIHSCINAKNAGLKINRHFLSIDYGKPADKALMNFFGNESEELEKGNFREQLKTNHYYFSELKSIDETILSNEDKTVYRLATDLDEVVSGYERNTLSSILDKIHFDKSCKVIELKIPRDLNEENGEEKLKMLDDILWDKKTGKTLDYLAIRKRATREWVFCFQTVLDESFDFAYVKIHHNKKHTDKWTGICENLDKIFLIGKSPDENGVLKDDELGVFIYPINNY